MEEIRGPKTIPVALALGDREVSWGRLLSLSARAAALSTQSALSRGEIVFLSFELSGERFKEIPARVEDSAVDLDGYTQAELVFTDEVERRRLAKTLLDLLSRR